MELIAWFVDFVLHLDRHLVELVTQYQFWTYAILFAIVFCETGLVVTPFLPGDSLLFAAGAFAARGSLDVATLFFMLVLAAIIGDSVNYSIGRYLAPRMEKGLRFVKHEHLERTHAFYEKYGGITIVLARFMPIIRTFAPFVAGIGAMEYHRFILYNVAGGLLWVSLFVFAGYFFGNIPAVADNFTYVIMAIIFVSILPAIIEFARQRLRKDPQGEG